MAMDRPQSIINFERFYLGSLAVSLLSSVLNWSTVMKTPGLEALPGWFMPVVLFISFGISILLWYFVARKGSVVSKWIVVIFFGLSLLGLPGMFLETNSGLTTPLMLVVALITYVLNAIAVWMLFRPDTKPWFEGVRTNLEDVFR
jgi:hypothetical protein